LKPVKKEELQQSLQKYRSVKAFFSSDELKSKMYDLLNQLKNETKNYKDRFLVNKGDSLIPVITSDIAYFYTEEKAVFLVKSDNKRFFINYSLDELEGLLDPASFYRVNRQFIINFNAIAKVYQYFNYKLKIELNPSIDKEIIISKANVSEFKNWLDR
jgi:two-component system, LytTR family, response regulator LytT